MRILYVTPYVPSKIRVRPYNFIKRLAKSHDVTLVVLTSCEQDIKALPEMREMCSDVFAVKLPKIQSIINCGKRLFTRIPLQAAYTWQPQATHQINHALTCDKYDVLHVEHVRGAHLASEIDCLPKVYDSVDCITLLLRQFLESKKNPIGWFLTLEEWAKMRMYEGMIPQFFDKVVITSAQDKEALDELIWQRVRKQIRTTGCPVGYKDITPKHREEWRLTRQLIEAAQDQRLAALMSGRQQVSVLPNGVDSEYFHPLDLPEKPDTIVFSGKMSYYANEAAVLHFYNSIFPLIRAKKPETKFTIVGSDPPASIKKLASDPHVEVTGYVEDIRPFIAGAAVAICPITVGAGIQNKVLEAMSMGKPVVASRKACRAIDVCDRQHLMIADSDGDFADAVIELLERRDLRRKIGSSAAEFVRDRHDWNELSRRLEGIYLEAGDVFADRMRAA